MPSVLETLMAAKRQRGALLIALIDPDNLDIDQARQQIDRFQSNGVDALFIGGSLIRFSEFDEFVKGIRETASIPVIGFPGSINQLSGDLDALLFLSVISGRNPDTLIGQHVQVAPILRKLAIEVIPTGYMLVESGALTSSHYINHALPIPRKKPGIAVATALAGEYLGLKSLYLEAGSGAEYPVPTEMLSAVCEATTLPVIVGGGIRKPEEAGLRARAGASMIVIGTAFEENDGPAIVQEFAHAVHRD